MLLSGLDQNQIEGAELICTQASRTKWPVLSALFCSLAVHSAVVRPSRAWHHATGLNDKIQVLQMGSTSLALDARFWSTRDGTTRHDAHPMDSHLISRPKKSNNAAGFY